MKSRSAETAETQGCSQESNLDPKFDTSWDRFGGLGVPFHSKGLASAAPCDSKLAKLFRTLIVQHLCLSFSVIGVERVRPEAPRAAGGARRSGYWRRRIEVTFSCHA